MIKSGQDVFSCPFLIREGGLMERPTLEAKVREKTGKSAAHFLRREGWVPAVLYGLKEETISLQVKEKEFAGIVKESGENAVIDLEIGGEADSAVHGIVKERQFDPVWGKLLHIDFLRISLTQKLTAEVPVVTIGESAGEKEGGILEHVLRHVEVECLPDKIPENIEVDVTGLEIGDSIHVEQLVVPADAEMVTEHDKVVISIVRPRVEEEKEVVEEEAEEPELVGRKEKEGEVSEGEKGVEKKKEKEEDKREDKGKDKAEDREKRKK